jgi:3-phosphoshikimate 1-carboxyvinyltransferase
MTNATRIEFFKTLSRMGLEIHWSSPQGSRTANDSLYLGEDVADVCFYRPGGVKLSAVVVQSDSSALMLDEIPALAVVCALAEGRSVIQGLHELKFKESDRLSQTVDLLTRAGVQAKAVSESLEITGTETPAAFSFGSDDHRMVMSAMILATRGTKASSIHGLRWIRTSFPLFLEAFQNIKSIMS